MRRYLKEPAGAGFGLLACLLVARSLFRRPSPAVASFWAARCALEGELGRGSLWYNMDWSAQHVGHTACVSPCETA